jgi:hypothetical protein
VRRAVDEQRPDRQPDPSGQPRRELLSGPIVHPDFATPAAVAASHEQHPRRGPVHDRDDLLDRGRSGGERIPLSRRQRPAWNSGGVAGERRRPVASSSSSDMIPSSGWEKAMRLLCTLKGHGRVARRHRRAWNSIATAALLPFHRCRSETGADRALADAWSSSAAGVSARYCRRDRIQAALFDVRALVALERSATGGLEWSRGRGSVLAAASPARFRRPGCSVPGVLRGTCCVGVNVDTGAVPDLTC